MLCKLAVLAGIFVCAVPFAAPSAQKLARRYAAEGIVVQVDAARQSVLVSHDRIPGYMDAMAMPFAVRTPEAMKDLKPGARIRFSLAVTDESSWIEDIKVIAFDSAAIDPVQTRRFRALENAMGTQQAALREGDRVPDFSLTDQTGQGVRLSQFAGRVVAINFVYTRCPLPDYCLRSSNNFGRIQARFTERLGRELMLLTVSFDPVHDQPAVLASYGKIWKADPRSWRFLTGSTAEVRRVCSMFGVGFWLDEGIMTHAVHAAIIDRTGRLVSNIEGNQYSAEQLGDLVEAALGK